MSDAPAAATHLDAHQAASGAAGGGKSKLMDRLRRRHLDALTGFQDKARQMSTAVDDAMADRLRDLRTELTMSRADADRRLDQTQAAIEEHRALIAASADASAARQWGDEAVLLVDEVHPAEEPFPVTLEKRQTRLEAARRRVLELGLALKHDHDSRMGAITAAEDFAKEAEAGRRAQLTQLLEALLEELSSIAYVGTTVSQLLVHRAALSTNQQLLDNDVSTKELFTKLRQHDILKQRAFAMRVAELYKAQVTVLGESVALWSRQVLTTPHFREPEARAETLVRVGRALKQTKNDVANLISGVGILVQTLLRNPHGIGSTVASEIPGGAVPSGWLQHFNHEQTALAVFKTGPEAIAEQWRVSVNVILQQLRHENGRIVEDAQASQRLLQQEAASVHAIMLHDIEQLYVPSAAELDVVAGCAHDTGDLEHAFPLHNVQPMPDEATTVQGPAAELTSAEMHAIAAEGQWFSEALVLQLFRRGASLVATLTGSTGGLVPIIADATSALHEVATSIAYLVRKQFAEHRDEFADFRDSLYRLEQAYQLTEDHLAHAGTVEQTQELCVQAMAQLKAIEKLYGAHHSSRSGKLPRFHEALQSAVDGSKKRLLEELCAEPLSDIKAKNTQLEAELAGLKERLATPATKKGEKAVKPADAQAQLAAAQEKYSKEYVDVSALAVAVVKEPEGGGAVEFAARVPAAVKYGAADVLAKPVAKAPPKDTAPPMSAKELKAQRAKDKKAASNKKEAAAAAAAAAAANKGGDQSLDGTMNGAGGTADEEMPVLEAPGEHEAFYFGVLRERLTPLFHDECLVSHDAVPSVINQLRAGVLQWIHDYAHRVFACASGFITETKARIDAETNECIRRHYRRAPVLQSQVFDVRVRELEDASQSRSKHTEWLHQRLAACMTHAMSAIHGTTEPVAHDIMAIEDARDALPRLTSIPTVDANQRGVTATAKKARGHVSGRLDDVASHSAHTIQVILRDADTFAAERLRSFEEGGDVSASEKEEGLEALRNLRATAEGTAADIKSSVQNARETQESKIDAALESYKTAYDHTTEELRFFSSLGDIIAAAKAKFSQQVAAGNAASNALEAAGAQLEALVGQSTTTARRDLATQRALASLQWDTLAGAAATPTSVAACTVPVDDTWSNADVALSDRLRRTHVESEAALQTSRAVEILRNVDELRKLAYSRGLYLGCLAYGCEFSPVSESTFFDPPKEPEVAADAGGAKAGGGAAAKGAGAGGKGGKNAPPTSSTPDALDASTRNWSAFTAVPRWDVQFTRALQPVRERAAAALDYFQKRPGALLRSEPWGADKDAVKATLDERFAALETRLAELISEGIKAYRLLVQRVHLLSHRVAHEVLVCVVNHGVHSLDARSGDAVAVLEAFARSMGTARVRASGLLKGSMAAPSSRNRLQAVATAEQQRQAKAKALFMVTAGILNRDAQDEGMRAAVRASQALSTVFTLLRSLVTPEHVVPGEQVVVGQHKGLKRLMRQRMREDAARALDEKGGVKPAADAKGGAKGGGKPEPKKAGGKDDAKGKGGKGGKGAQDAKDEDDVQQLGALERPSHDYAGIRANAVLCYDEWRRGHPGVTLRDHYSAPATWAAAEAAAQAEAAAAAAPAAGKKGAAPAKAAAGKGAAGDKKGADAPGATAATIPEAEPIVTPTLTAPHERLFQAAWLSRQQLVEVAHGVCTALVGAAEAKTIELTKGEDAWAASWADAVAALLNSTESAAPATSTNAAPTRAAPKK